MARDAADKIAAHGFRMLKIKTGQGAETDFASFSVRFSTLWAMGIRMYAELQRRIQTCRCAAWT